MSRGTGHRREGGAVVVEAALVLTFVSMVVFGVIEYGFAYRDVNTIERSLQSAGRVGSGLGRNRFADYETLRSIATSVDNLAGASLQRVIIYKPTGLDGDVPAACLAVAATGTSAKGVAGTCNVYSPAQVMTASPIGFPDNGSATCGTGWDQLWCPFARDDTAPNTSGFGVYVEVDYEPFTYVIDHTMTIERTAVYRVEPCVPGTGANCA